MHQHLLVVKILARPEGELEMEIVNGKINIGRGWQIVSVTPYCLRVNTGKGGHIHQDLVDAICDAYGKPLHLAKQAPESRTARWKISTHT